MRNWNGIRRLGAVMVLVVGLAMLPAAPALASADDDAAASESSLVQWFGDLVQSVVAVFGGPGEGEGGPRLDPSG